MQSKGDCYLNPSFSPVKLEQFNTFALIGKWHSNTHGSAVECKKPINVQG